MVNQEPTLECVTISEENYNMHCHTDCGPMWDD